MSAEQLENFENPSMLSLDPPDHSRIRKLASKGFLRKYIQSLEENELPNTVETLSTKDQFNEYIMTGLRTIWGVSLQKIEDDFGLEYKNQLLKSAQKFIDKDLLVRSQETNQSILTTTQKGKFLVDGIASELFMI